METFASHPDLSIAKAMRAPGRSRQQFYLGAATDKALVGDHAGPMLARIRIIVKFPAMDQFLDHASTLEAA
jgi:hypothetical protein